MSFQPTLLCCDRLSNSTLAPDRSVLILEEDALGSYLLFGTTVVPQSIEIRCSVEAIGKALLLRQRVLR
jgi:hypothetical protein